MIEAFHGVCPFEALAQRRACCANWRRTFGGKQTIVAATDATWEAAEITAWSRDSLRFSYQRGWIEQFDGRQTSEREVAAGSRARQGGHGPVERRSRCATFHCPLPLLPVRPAEVVAVQRGDGFVGNVEPDARFELPGRSGIGNPSGSDVWKPSIRNDAAAAANPAGVTSKGAGDTILQGDGASIAYDLGLGYVGFVGFEVSGREGQVLEIVWNERLSDGGAVRPRAQTGNNAIRYTLREGRQSFLAFMPQFVRFLRVVQRGEGQMTLHRLWLTEFRFVAEPKGRFPLLRRATQSRIQAARRTAMLEHLGCLHGLPSSRAQRDVWAGRPSSMLEGRVSDVRRHQR